MNLRLPLLFSFALVIAMAAVSAWAWMILPDNTVLATHWGLHGEVNGTMSKTGGLIILPAIALAITLLLSVVPRIDPRGDNIAASRKPFFALWLGAVVIMAVSHALIVAAALKYPIDVPGVVIILIPVFFAVAGNYLGKAKPNFFIGIRTPWTLSSNLSWEKTHRMVGRLFVLSALIILAVRFTLGVEAAFLTLAITIPASVLLAFVSSYVFWKHDPARRAGA